MLDSKPYDILVFIGRFQPFHRGHKEVVDRALHMAARVAILIGSANCARSLRNPWTYQERHDLIAEHYKHDDSHRPSLHPLDDVLYNDTAWLEQAQAKIKLIVSTMVVPEGRPLRIGLIGAAKDHTSYYLKMFPGWDSEDVSFFSTLHATNIRTAYFHDHPLQSVIDAPRLTLTVQTLRFLQAFAKRQEYVALCQEATFIDEYKRQWAAAPYPPVFSTVDAVVVQSGHILLVRRKGFPGQGQLALPGGFIGQTETLLQSAIRELREETRLKVPEPVLLGSLKKRDIFDDPNRSSRGRTITTAFLFHLADAETLPKVRGGDDAAEANWHPLGTLNPCEIYEDHAHIIRSMTAGI